MKDLIRSLTKLKSYSNQTDVMIEIAIFEPDENYTSARPNAAGTKVIYTSKNGEDVTYWAPDYTKTQESRDATLSLLRTKETSHDL